MNETEAVKAAETEDQSMEEILQSIRRIITEDEKQEAEETVEESSAKKEEPVSAEPAVGGDDLDELDKILAEDATDASHESKDDLDSDILELTEILEEETPIEEEIVNPVEEIVEEALEEVVAPVDMVVTPSVPEVDVEETTDTLVSEGTAAVTSAIFDEVKQAADSAEASDGLALRSGTSVEDLMIEAMRPMLKAWLDKNLPAVVERVVQKEVKKLAE